MSAWGVGLFASDVAAEISAMLRALVRVPLSIDEIVDATREMVPALNDSDHEDHCNAWLVLAEGLHAYGFDHEDTFIHANYLIDSGRDLQEKAAAGLAPIDLHKRASNLEHLKESLDHPVAFARDRRLLDKPQPYLLDVGECVTYPADEGRCANPYLAWPLEDPHWHPDGWGAALVLDRGYAFGYLAWYFIAQLDATSITSLDKDDCVGAKIVHVGTGTMSRSHYHKMDFHSVGQLNLDDEIVRQRFEEMNYCEQGRSKAICNVGLSMVLDQPVNRLDETNYLCRVEELLLP